MLTDTWTHTHECAYSHISTHTHTHTHTHTTLSISLPASECCQQDQKKTSSPKIQKRSDHTLPRWSGDDLAGDESLLPSLPHWKKTIPMNTGEWTWWRKLLKQWKQNISAADNQPMKGVNQCWKAVTWMKTTAKTWIVYNNSHLACE